MSSIYCTEEMCEFLIDEQTNEMRIDACEQFAIVFQLFNFRRLNHKYLLNECFQLQRKIDEEQLIPLFLLFAISRGFTNTYEWNLILFILLCTWFVNFHYVNIVLLCLPLTQFSSAYKLKIIFSIKNWCEIQTLRDIALHSWKSI